MEIPLANGRLKQVRMHKYLGAWINEKDDPDEEICCRIEQARAAFVKMRKTLTTKNLLLDTRIRVLKCYYVWSVLLYGCETWTLKAGTMNKLEVFEMWCYRRMLKVP